MVGLGIPKVTGEMIHPVYAGLSLIAVSSAEDYYKKFKNKPTAVLQRYEKLLEPKNFFDKLFYASLFNERLPKSRAIDRVLWDRKMEESKKESLELLNAGASQV